MKPSELLTDETKWTKGALARDVRGIEVPATSPEASCWCLLGALQGEIPDEWKKLTASVCRLFPKFASRGAFCVMEFNNAPETTFADVRRVLIEAGL